MEIIRKWGLWANASTNRKIFNAIIIIASLSFIGKLVSLAKEIAVADSFGTSDVYDAFLMAFMVPSFAITVISGSFNAALIPTYIRVREQEGPDASQKLFSSSLLWSLGMLTIATILIVIAAPFYLPYLAAGFSAEKIALTRRLLYLLSPIILFCGISTIGGAVLNADERFGIVAITPVITPLVVLCMLCFGRERWGVTALTLGTVSGMVLEALIIGTVVKRKGISIWPKWYGFDSNLRKVVKQYVPMIAGAFLMSGTGFVNQSMAAMLGSGSVAALNYGNRLISVPVGLASMALGTAVIPYFSTMVARQDWQGVRHTLRRYYRLIFFVSLPATFFVVLISEPMVRLLYQRGSFTVQDTHLVSLIQSLFALQIPFYIAGILIVRLMSALLANHILMIGNIISLTVCIVLNNVFMHRMGVAGIALSTSCVYLVSFLFLHFSWLRIAKNI